MTHTSFVSLPDSIGSCQIDNQTDTKAFPELKNREGFLPVYREKEEIKYVRNMEQKRTGKKQTTKEEREIGKKTGAETHR
jgi:hypothetical protein